MSNLLKTLSNTPILADYPTPTQDFISLIQQGLEPVRMDGHAGFLIENSYFKLGFPGTNEVVYTRSAVLGQLKEALELLQPEYHFVIFDAYRSKETQIALFQSFYQQFKIKNPNWSEEELLSETRNFAADPYGHGKYEILPHNSGGAVDLALIKNEKLEDFGTVFDDLTTRAATIFFEAPYDPSLGITLERWELIRKNRRILFNAMKLSGFTNYRNEWWHYDLGNGGWAEKFQLPWIFDSLEPKINNR